MTGPNAAQTPSSCGIRPFRYYQTGYYILPGSSKPTYEAMILKAGAPGAFLADLAVGGDFISPEEVLEMLEQWAKVRDVELTNSLCHDLNIMRVTQHAETIKIQHDPVEIFQKALNVLTRSLPAMIEETNLSLARDAVGGVLSGAISRRRRLGRGLSRLDLAVQNMGRHLVPSPGRKNQSAFWHGDARYLAFQLNCWAQKNNRRLGFTKPTALGVAFIHHALNRARVAHGSTPDGAQEAIASELARWRRSSRRSSLGQGKGGQTDKFI